MQSKISFKRVDSKLDLDFDVKGVAVTGKSYGKFPALPKQAQFETLPCELHVEILGHITNVSDLLQLRLVNSYMRGLVDRLLETRFNVLIDQTRDELETSQKALVEVKTVHEPIMSHCQSFIRRASGRNLTELMHHNSPVTELQTVCACLCLLLGVDASNVRNYRGPYTLDRLNISTTGSKLPSCYAKIDSNGDMRWSEIKRAMSRAQFRAWYSDLPNTVQAIPLEFVEYVENVIRADPDITYERLAAVSSAAHEVLVIISACLHYVRSFQAFKARSDEVGKLEQKYNQQRQFIQYLKL